MPINEDLSTKAVTAMSISSDGNVIYAATEGEGVFRLEVIKPGETVLEVDPTSLVFGEFGEVEIPQSKTLTFRAYNTGGGTLSGTVSDDRDWITVDPTSLTGNSNTISVTVHADIMGLQARESYIGTVTVNSNGGILKP